MARTSFLDRVQPNRARSKLIDWPFAVEGEKPRVRVKVLGTHELEGAYLATSDHFKSLKFKVVPTDGLFVAREHVELAWRAYEDESGNPLTASAADLAREPAEIIQTLYAEWASFQNEVAARPLSQAELDELIAELKKNSLAVLPDALPSTWLRQLITTLASQLAASTPENSPGS